MALITCNNLSFAYEGNIVVQDLQFTVNSGDYLCIVGENGSGKSTLMKGLLNLQKPFAGEIIKSSTLKKSDVGYIPQQTVVQKDFPASVYEVALSGRLSCRGLWPFYSKKDKKIVLENLEKFGIAHLKNRCYRELSGGQQQRVLLCRAMCSAKKIIFMDEPVAGLDSAVSKQLYQIIHEMNREHMTIVMVSHDMDSLQYASHVLHVQNRQLFFGPKSDYTRTELAGGLLGGNAYA